MDENKGQLTFKKAMEEFIKNSGIKIMDSIEFKVIKKEDKINEKEVKP